jgi:hypothetical protein
MNALFVQITTTLKLSAKEGLHCNEGFCLNVGFYGKRFFLELSKASFMHWLFLILLGHPVLNNNVIHLFIDCYTDVVGKDYGV